MRRVAAAVAVVVTLTPLLGLAESVLVPEVTLRQTGAASYAVEAFPAPEALGALRTPVWSEGCQAEHEPTVDMGPPIVWRVEVACAEPLTASDSLYLPWPLDGARVTAVWTSGEMPARLFGRQGPGIVVSLDALMPRATGLMDVAGSQLGPAWRHALGWAHLVLALALVVTLAPSDRRRALGGLTAGHGAALVLSELGGVGVPLFPAEATMAVGAALLLARSGYWPDHPLELGFVGAVIGVVHGLGLATGLAADGVSGPTLVPALFVHVVTVDVVLWGLGLGGSRVAARWLGRRPRHREVAAFGLGVWSAFVAFDLIRDGMVPAVASPDPPAVYAASTPAGTADPLSTVRQTSATGRLVEPAMSYLSVEPYRIRHEVLVAVDRAPDWLSVSSEDGRIPVEVQERLKTALITRITEAGGLRVDGVDLRPTTTRADFVTIDPNGVLVRETPVPEPFDTAVIGVTLQYAVEGLPDEVSISWSSFPDAGARIPMEIADPVTEADHLLTAKVPGVTWRNTLGDYQLPDIEAIAIDKPRLPWLSFLALGLAVPLLIGARAPQDRRRSLGAVGLLLVAYLAYPSIRVPATVPFLAEAGLPGDEAAPVLEALLTNVYRAFDIHDEAAIYDRLALTVTGEQLTDVYLESRRALELENRGGATVVIDEVVVRDVTDVRAAGAGTLQIQAAWTVGGSVTHFGHEHFRQNAYQAAITLAPVDDTWKIASIEILDERRVL